MTNLTVMLAEFMLNARNSKGASQDEFSEFLNINSRTLQRYEKAERIPTQEVLDKASEVLGQDISEFIKGKEEAKNIAAISPHGSLRMFMKIPEKVILDAQRFELNDEVWDSVKEIFEDRIKKLDKAKAKDKRA